MTLVSSEYSSLSIQYPQPENYPEVLHIEEFWLRRHPPCLQKIRLPALVGGIPTHLKNISQLGWLFPKYGKIKTCSKAPTRAWSSGPFAILWVMANAMNGVRSSVESKRRYLHSHGYQGDDLHRIWVYPPLCFLRSTGITTCSVGKLLLLKSS